MKKVIFSALTLAVLGLAAGCDKPKPTTSPSSGSAKVGDTGTLTSPPTKK